MRRLLLWIPPPAICAVWLSSPAALHGAGPRFLACAALALALELAARNTWRGLPTYRRHNAIFCVVTLAGVCSAGHPRLLDCVLAATGTVLGLGLSCLPLLWLRWLPALSWRGGEPRRPDPARPLVLVADPHWNEGLTGLREATAAFPQADWLFLGDLFDVWVGLPGMGSPLQAEFMTWVDERRACGRWIGCWLGNREFFLDGLSRHFDLMGEGIGGGLPAEGLAWEHGDLINAADWRYRLWNLASRSGVMWLVARLLPLKTAAALAAHLERRMRTTNRAYKLAFPRAAFRSAAATRSGDVFITGHFHTYEQEGNGTALPWAHEGDFMLWQDRTLKPMPPSPRP